MDRKRRPRRHVAGLALATTVAAIVVATASAGTIHGTPKSDTLRGTAAADRLYGNAGNDKLYGLAGNDYLNGGPGNDVLYGGPGVDTLACGPGRDTAVANAGDKVGADCETVQGLPKPALSVAGASQAEGDAGSQPMSFTVTLAKPTPLRVSVAYATADGTATAGTDYTAASGTLVFAAGETRKTISVPIVGDTASEPDETFTLDLSSPVNATLGVAQATGTITTDDPAPRAGHYAGQTSQGKAIAFDVSPDLASVANLSFAILLECTAPGGPTIIINNFGPITFGSGTWPLDPSKHWGDTFTIGGDALTGKGSIAGSFDSAGHASGTLNVDITIHLDSGDLGCSSKSVSWSAP